MYALSTSSIISLHWSAAHHFLWLYQALPDDYELDTRHSGMPLPSRGLHYNPTQKSSGGRPHAGRDVKLPPGDNLSLHSDDIESEYDSASRKAGGRGNGSAVDVVEFGASKV